MAEPALSSAKENVLWKGSIAVVGIMTTLVIYGLLQEKIMRVPYGENKEFFKYSLFLVFCNRLVTSAVSAGALLASKKDLDPVAPVYKYCLISVSNILTTTCQYEALKYVSFPVQTLAKCAKMIPVMSEIHFTGFCYFAKSKMVRNKKKAGSRKPTQGDQLRDLEMKMEEFRVPTENSLGEFNAQSKETNRALNSILLAITSNATNTQGKVDAALTDSVTSSRRKGVLLGAFLRDARRLGFSPTHVESIGRGKDWDMMRRELMARFIPEAQRISRFKLGLTKRLQDELVLFNAQSLSEVVKMAYRAETKLKSVAYSYFTPPVAAATLVPAATPKPPGTTVPRFVTIMGRQVWGTIIMQKKYKGQDYLFAVLVTLGCSLFILYPAAADISPNNRGRESTVWGVSLMMGYLGFDGFTSTFQDKLFKGYNMEIYNQIFYTSLCSCILSLSGLILQGHLLLAVNFVSQHNDCFFDIALLSTVATISQFFISYTIRTFGALTFATIMTTRQVNRHNSYTLFILVLSYWKLSKVIVFGSLYARSFLKSVPPKPVQPQNEPEDEESTVLLNGKP
ncbi:hypothetical protein GIB67_014211 [Kingdonia uniflora]|uniref:Uncharacterized protein n=1 Tax=Kingdonia uniflora TaxID=39325 RepID=A0A7J7M207_9MAGN|nr:hypothetical protein GIB67_014211 [Kingdonia uniflora]